jgi:predicted AAA+ superfamily ATPase
MRNAAIDNLKPLTERDDLGALWKNFVLAERLKWLHYHQPLASLYFWRTYTGAEIDIVEEREGGTYAYECRWTRPAGRASRVPASFLDAYPGPSFEVITRESYRAYLGA